MLLRCDSVFVVYVRVFFFFTDTATTEIYTLSLHDALPISDLRHPHGPAPRGEGADAGRGVFVRAGPVGDRKSTRLNSSHLGISYAVFCLKKKKKKITINAKNNHRDRAT